MQSSRATLGALADVPRLDNAVLAYRPDLLFYHVRLLHCYVVVELTVGDERSEAGQLGF